MRYYKVGFNCKKGDIEGYIYAESEYKARKRAEEVFAKTIYELGGLSERVYTLEELQELLSNYNHDNDEMTGDEFVKWCLKNNM